MINGVSFCIPTYNRFDTLVEALNSVLELAKLDFLDHEIIISDDGNDDCVKRYIDELKNHRVSYILNKDHGQFNNLNNLIDKSEKEWIIFLHDDDILDNDYLEYFLILNESAYEKAEIFFTDRSYINPSGKLIKNQTAFNSNRQQMTILEGKKVFDRLFFGGFEKEKFSFTAPMVTGLAIKRDVLRQVRGFDLRLSVNSDALFLNEVFFITERVLYVNKTLLSYRVVEDSERGKPSKKGIVYGEMKKLFLYTLEFLKSRMNEADYLKLKEEKTSKFYKNSMEINGPLFWIALRYEGNYTSRINILIAIFKDILKEFPPGRFNVKLYLILIISLLPQVILKGLYTNFYLKRSI